MASSSGPKSQSLRPLLPAPNHPVPALNQTPRRHKTNIAAACQACQKRKSKCSGARPKCISCIQRSIECNYATSARTETHTQALKRKYQDLVVRKDQKSVHEELFDLIKSMTHAEASEVLQRIRAGHTADAILKYVQDGNLLLQLRLIPEASLCYQLPYTPVIPETLLHQENPYLASFVYEVASMQVDMGDQRGVGTPAVTEHQSLYTKPYHAADIIEPRLQQLKPSLWTSVNKNDVLMRSLLASYIKYDYQIFPIFHLDHFLDAMANLDHNCCSSLLVNAVLAYACHCNTNLPTRFQYWNPVNLGYQFLAEAKRLWELQTSQGNHRTLPTAEALMIINMICNIGGLDKIGDTYGLQGISIAHEIGLFDNSTQISDRRLQDAMSFAAWAIFNLQSQLCWNFFRTPSILQTPNVPLPNASRNSRWFSEIWIKYPLDQTIFPTYFGLTFEATCTFRVIINNICQESFGQSQKLQSHSAKSLMLDLLKWYADLPEVLKPKCIVLPVHFVLHLDYHIVLLTLLQPFASEDWSPDPSPSEILVSSDRSLHTIMRLYYIRHGHQSGNAYLVSPLAKLAFAALQNITALVEDNSQLPHQQLESARSTLFLATTWLYYQGCSFFLPMSIYRIVMNQMRPQESILLQRIFQPGPDGNEIDAASQKGIADIHAQWIPAIVKLSEDPAAQRLSQLVAQLNDTITN